MHHQQLLFVDLSCRAYTSWRGMFFGNVSSATRAQWCATIVKLVNSLQKYNAKEVRRRRWQRRRGQDCVYRSGAEQVPKRTYTISPRISGKKPSSRPHLREEPSALVKRRKTPRYFFLIAGPPDSVEKHLSCFAKFAQTYSTGCRTFIIVFTRRSRTGNSKKTLEKIRTPLRHWYPLLC